MHQDAERNYERGELHDSSPANLQEMPDKQVVLTYWGNTRYQLMTDDKHLDSVPQAVRERWNKVATAGTPADWRDIRMNFEKHGWS